MSGGLLQIAAFGAQDIYLTGNPEITFFKTIYKRHTNFAIEAFEERLGGNVDFGQNNITCKLSKKGDLLSKIYLKMEISGKSLNGKFAFVSKIGHALINYIDLKIGGSLIERQYGDWFNIWQELTNDKCKDKSYNELIGNITEATTLNNKDINLSLFIPLNFFFCKNIGLALPIVSLNLHDIEFIFSFRKGYELVIKEYSTTRLEISMKNVSLLTNYIFLDTEERKKFTENNHEYLIEQVQFNGVNKITNEIENIKMIFNHPCKGIYWIINNSNNINEKLYLSTDLTTATKRVVLAYSKLNPINNNHILLLV